MTDSTQNDKAQNQNKDDARSERTNRRLDLLISMSSWFPKNNIDVSLS